MSSLPFLKISLVTPNYNYAHFLESTLRTVLDQGYPNLEYIVMDDGSTDESVSIIRKYADRLAHWETGPNRGQYKRITEGFAKSSGEIMGWINSDDMHFPWTLSVVAEIFQKFPDILWISTLAPGAWDRDGYCLGFGSNRGYSRTAFLDGRYLPTLAKDSQGVPSEARHVIQQESTFWRRALWDKAGGYVSQDFGSAGDFELWARFFQHADLVGVSVPLAGFRHQDRQQTAQAQKYANFCHGALVKHRLEHGWRPPQSRFLSYRTHLWLLPRVRGWVVNHLGYDGQKLVRENPAAENACWKRVSHRFY